MKKRFLLVLALTVVLVMTAASVAMAVPDGEEISNELELKVTVGEEVELQDPRFTLTGYAETSAVGLYDNFTMKVDAGDYEETRALGKIELTEGQVDGFDLEFKLPDGTWFGPVKFGNAPGNDPKVYYFGSKPQGDKLGNVKDTDWRVTWKRAGTYEFEVSIVKVGENYDEEQLGETVAVTVEVVAGQAMGLQHATANAGEYAKIKDETVFIGAMQELRPNLKLESLTKNINKGETFDYVIAADLANDVSHVDNVLFIFEVTKDNIAVSDFEITEISLRDNTEGINDTFEIGAGGILRGFWGPPKGDLFKGPAATAFTVKFNTEGTYTVNTYAIQVARAK